MFIHQGGVNQNEHIYKQTGCIQCHQYRIDVISFLPCCYVIGFDPLFGNALRDQQISDRLEFLSLDHNFLSGCFSWEGAYGRRGCAGFPEFFGEIICFDLEVLELGDAGDRAPFAGPDDDGNLFQFALPEASLSEYSRRMRTSTGTYLTTGSFPSPAVSYQGCILLMILSATSLRRRNPTSWSCFRSLALKSESASKNTGSSVTLT